MTEHGWDWTESWAYRFINRDKTGDLVLGDPDLVGRVTQRLTTETTQMEAKVKEFIGNFEHAATDDTRELLKNSEAQVKSEAQRYGLKVSGYVDATRSGPPSSRHRTRRPRH